MKDWFAGEIAERYDESTAGKPAGPVVDFLLPFADGGALELAIGTGRVAVPLAERGVPVTGIELSPHMVEQLRTGPPAWSPSRVARIDEAMNGAELFIHHEDVRRGLPGWEPRGADETRDGAVWDTLTRMGRMLYRHSPVGVVVRRPTGEQAVIKTGTGLVTVEGEPGEILLHAFGRDAVRVELRGQPADVAALSESSRGV